MIRGSRSLLFSRHRPLLPYHALIFWRAFPYYPRVYKTKMMVWRFVLRIFAISIFWDLPDGVFPLVVRYFCKKIELIINQEWSPE